MKSRAEERQKDYSKFPGLYKSINCGPTFIVLATGLTSGMVVYSTNSNNQIGVIDDWIRFDNEDCWERFKGSVTLEN